MLSRNVSLTCENSVTTLLKTLLFDTYEAKNKIKENRDIIKKEK